MESVIGWRPKGARCGAAVEFEAVILCLAMNDLAAAPVPGREARRFGLLHCHTGRGHDRAEH